MWIISNRALNKLLNGDYSMAIELKKRDKELTVKDLFCVQFEYESYDGFRKFYNKYLKGIIDELKFISDKSLIGKIISKLGK